MTVLMYDAIDANAIPANAQMAAGYVDGNWPSYNAIKARFPHIQVISIAVFWTSKAQVLDVETGDATPAQAVEWCTKTMASTPNNQLVLYCNESSWPSVRAAFRSAGASEPCYWIASYDGNPTIPSGAVAKQYASVNAYDTSSVSSAWPGLTITENDMTPAETQQLTDIHKAVVEASIASKIDGVDHTLSEHEAATNGWVFQIRNDVDALKTQMATLLSAVDAVAKKIGL